MKVPLFVATLGLLFVPQAFVSADFEIPEHFLGASHAGVDIIDPGSSDFDPITPTISGDDLNAMHGDWDIHIVNDSYPTLVPAEHGVYALFRGTHGAIDGTPADGVNYSYIKDTIQTSASGTTTKNVTFGLPFLGDPDTPSGAYTLVVAQLPETKFAYDPFIDDYVEMEYSDVDFLNWFIQPEGVEIHPPIGFLTLEFAYIAGGEEQSQTPTVSALGQFRQFGVDGIAESTTFIDNAAMFKGTIADGDSTEAKLEVELKPIGEAFDGSGTIESALGPLGEFSVTVDELIPVAEHYTAGGNEKDFHWRARAVDGEDNASEWTEFGDVGNIDFTAKVVPLWTQVASQFPQRLPGEEWAEEIFANGAANQSGDCGATFRACGCAITSTIMIAQHFGVQNGPNGPMNPLNFDAWLLQNSPEYAHDGSFMWDPMETYSGGKLTYLGDQRFDIPEDPNYQNTVADFARLDEYVANATNPIPVIGKTAYFKNHGGVRRTHFFVIDSKIGANYGVRDPYWFETKTLDDATSVPQLVRRYEGSFDGLRIYEPNESLAYVPRMIHALGSPAELLFSDAQDRRLGKDPRTGQVFNEIPGGRYFEDDRISNPDENVPDVTPRESNKVLEIDNPPVGAYTLEVIGTGTGGYSLVSSFTDSAGESSGETFHASTSPNAVSSYEGNFDAADASGSDIEAQKTPLQVFAELKAAVNAATIKPPLLKASIKASVLLAEELYKKGRIALAKLTLKGLAELIKSKKGKGIAPADAERFLQLITELQSLLKV